VEGELIFDQGKFTKVNETDILMRAQQKANELFQLSMKNR
jgi:hypothetical protein